MSRPELALWLLVGLVLLAAALRVRSLVRPTAYPPRATRFLEGPLRRRFAGAGETLRRSGLEPGMRALEVGPGGGYLSEGALPLLGARGRLVCLDLQIEMLQIDYLGQVLPHIPPRFTVHSSRFTDRATERYPFSTVNCQP